MKNQLTGFTCLLFLCLAVCQIGISQEALDSKYAKITAIDFQFTKNFLSQKKIFNSPNPFLLPFSRFKEGPYFGYERRLSKRFSLYRELGTNFLDFALLDDLSYASDPTLYNQTTNNKYDEEFSSPRSMVLLFRY